MGVKQLTSYIEQHHDILFKNRLKIDGMKLVFDGGSLYYTLSRTAPKRFGGDYDKLYRSFRNFFEKLANFNITPYVVLDGGHNLPLKTETDCGRYERDIGALTNLTVLFRSQYNLPKPLLTKYLFIQVMQEMGIKYVVAKREADLLIAAVANRIGCPVVTTDSDFYVTNVTYGVLTLDSILKLNEKCVECFSYQMCYLADHLKVQENLLPFIALIMGNDYSTDEYLDSIQKTCGVQVHGRILPLYPRMQCIAEYLRQFEEAENVIEHFCTFADMVNEVSLRGEIVNILQEFDCNSVNDECNEIYEIMMREPIMKIDATDLPTKRLVESVLITLVHHGLVNPSVIDVYFAKMDFINIQCENTALKCSSQLSLTLRKYIYSLLLAQSSEDVITVTEYRRAGQEYKPTKIEFCVEELKKMPYDVLTEHYSTSKRQGFLCKITGYASKYLKSVEDPSMSLFLMSIRYWITQTSQIGEKLKIEHIHAALISYVHLVVSKEEIPHIKNKFVDLSMAQHYCRWQSIVFYLYMLNDLLLRALEPPKLEHLFNGSFTHHTFHKLVQGESPYKILQKPEQPLYEKLAEIVTEGMNDYICYKTASHHHHYHHNQKHQHAGGMSRNSPRKPDVSPNEKEKKNKSCNLNNSGNRFAALMDSDEEMSVESEESD